MKALQKFAPAPIIPHPYEKENYILFDEVNFKSKSSINSNLRQPTNFEKFKNDYGTIKLSNQRTFKKNKSCKFRFRWW